MQGQPCFLLQFGMVLLYMMVEWQSKDGMSIAFPAKYLAPHRTLMLLWRPPKPLLRGGTCPPAPPASTPLLCHVLGGPKLNFQTTGSIITLSRFELSSCKERKAVLGVSSHDISRTLKCVLFVGSAIMPNKLTSSDCQVCIFLYKLKSIYYE